MKKYIYFDWNVFQAIKRKDHQDFNEIITKLSVHKYIVPFSEGHLRDLSNSKEEYVKEDLDFIYNISNANILCFADNESIIYKRINKDDIYKLFAQLKDEYIPEIDLDFKINSSYKIDTTNIETSLLKQLLQANNGILNSEVMHLFIKERYENMNDPVEYKKFREEVAHLKKQFSNTPNSIIDQQGEYFRQLAPFIEFLSTDNLDLLKFNFNDTMISFLNIDKTIKLNEMTLHARIELAYSLLDFHPKFRDQISKKNKPFNMMRDIKHLIFASQAQYYVTKDNTAYKKSKFICEVFDLKVKIVTIEEFIAKFS
jgi:hypothetical protein